MKYAVIKCVNGNFAIATEHGENKEGGIIAFHNLASALWNDNSEVNATVKLVDENLDTVDGYVEYISHGAKEI